MTTSYISCYNFDLPGGADAPAIRVWVHPHQRLDLSPDSPCPHPVTYGINANGKPILISRLAADPDSPTLQELAWRAVARHAGDDLPTPVGVDPTIPVLDYPGAAAFLAEHGDWLRAALGREPLMDDRPLDPGNHAWLRERAVAIGYALGHAAGQTIPLGPLIESGAKRQLATGQEISRACSFTTIDYSPLRSTYQYQRLVTTTPPRQRSVSGGTEEPPAFETYDELLKTAFHRGRDAALADRLAIDPNPFTP